jgi:hypothetical protein
MATTISGTSGVTYPAGGTDNTAGTGVGTTDTQTLTNKTLGSGLVAGASYLTSGTAVTLTTQTNVDFTGIPSWVKRVTIMLNAISVNSTTPYLIYQLGYGATPTFENTGYLENVAQINSAPSAVFGTNTTTAFSYSNGIAAVSDTLSGIIILTNVSGNIWVASGIVSRNGNNAVAYSAGSKTISGGALTAIRFTTSSGTDQYDAGSINILYE